MANAVCVPCTSSPRSSATSPGNPISREIAEFSKDFVDHDVSAKVGKRALGDRSRHAHSEFTDDEDLSVGRMDRR
jgi:hypothetical protein